MRLPLLLALTASLAGAEEWKLQYFYDEKNSSLHINDLCFPTPQRGVAGGFISEGQRTRPALVVTSDGGRR